METIATRTRLVDAPPASPDRVPAPLLPPLLAQPAVYLWLWTLPVGVMLALNAQAYWLIGGNMDAAQRHWAIVLGIAGVVNLVAGLASFAWMRGLARRNASTVERVPWFGVVTILFQIAYLWLATAVAEDVVPRSVAAWIYPPTRFLFNQYTFAMVPLFLGILQIACAQPRGGVVRSLKLSVAGAIGAPIALYLAFHLVIHSGADGAFGATLLATLVGLTGVAMLVGIVRTLMLGLRFAQKWGDGANRFAVGVIALVLPLLGLGLNRTIDYPVDFQASEVYALTVINAAILLFATWKRATAPWLSLSLLCGTFPFTLYFFVVLLPFTPLSILAVIFFGFGFLALTPTFLFVLHVHLLYQSVRTLRGAKSSPWRIAMAATAGFLVLPGVFTARAVADKTALNSALDYVTAPTIRTSDTRFNGDRANLRRALASHRAYKNGIYYPFLSDFYSWVVFDSLVLPDTTLSQLETVFFGAAGSAVDIDPVRISSGVWGRTSVRRLNRAPRRIELSNAAVIDGLDVRTAGTGSNGVVTLGLTLRNDGSAQAEYRTTLPLPAGTFVSGFRLDVNGTLTPGRVVEKKTAQWVYAMIRDSERRDPGLLRYTKPDELELSVFPIDARNPKRVEIDFLIPGKLDSTDAPTGNRDPSNVLNWIGRQLGAEVAAGDTGAYLSLGAMARTLPPVARAPYVHLIVDRSEANGYDGDLATATEVLRTKFPSADRVRVTLANFDVVDLFPSLTPWAELTPEATTQMHRTLVQRGGFAVDLAVAHALRLHRDYDLDARSAPQSPPLRPVVVILTRKASDTPWDIPVARAWAELCPGLEIYQLDRAGRLTRSLEFMSPVTPLVRRGNSVRPVPNYGSVMLAATEEAPVEYWAPEAGRWLIVPNVRSQPTVEPWAQAAALQMEAQRQLENPAGKRTELAALVHRSRASGVLMPLTSYIVVENEAQWRKMDQAERQKLGQNAALEFQETPSPSALALGALFIGYLAARSRLRRRIRSDRMPKTRRYETALRGLR